jgi:4-hydroxybenzoate polyprenyltransferase
MYKLLKDLNELVMFKHSIFSLPFIFIAMITAADGWFGWRLLFLGLFAAVSARNFAMGFNRYVDRGIDAKNPRTIDRPSVDGRVEVKKQILFIVANAFLFVISAYFINDLAFKLSFFFLIILGGYSLFKRFSSLAHLVLGLSLALAPIAGAIAVDETLDMWVWLLSLGVMFWVAGFDLLYSLQDMEFDKEEGLFSIPSQYGSKCTLFISRVFHALTVLFWLLFAISSLSGFFVYVAVFISAVTLFWEHMIVIKDFKKIDRAFFTLNGYLGIVFFVLVVIDKM